MPLDIPEVLLPQEVAEITRTSDKDVLEALEQGQLPGFRLGKEWRVTARALRAYMLPGGPTSSGQDEKGEVAPQAQWRAATPFEFRWPDGKLEHYHSAFEADVTAGDKQQHVVIGYGERQAAGKERRRVVVFFGVPPRLVPVVEFTGTDDHAQTRRVASIIKDRSGHHVRQLEQLPPEYQTMSVAIYSDVVVGPNAARSVAVVVAEDERDVMARHALIRGGYKGWFKP